LAIPGDVGTPAAGRCFRLLDPEIVRGDAQSVGEDQNGGPVRFFAGFPALNGSDRYAGTVSQLALGESFLLADLLETDREAGSRGSVRLGHVGIVRCSA